MTDLCYTTRMLNWTGEDHLHRLELRAAVEDPEFPNLTREEQLVLKEALHELTMRYTNFLLRRA